MLEPDRNCKQTTPPAGLGSWARALSDWTLPERELLRRAGRDLIRLFGLEPQRRSDPDPAREHSDDRPAD